MDCFVLGEAGHPHVCLDFDFVVALVGPTFCRNFLLPGPIWSQLWKPLFIIPKILRHYARPICRMLVAQNAGRVITPNHKKKTAKLRLANKFCNFPLSVQRSRILRSDYGSMAAFKQFCNTLPTPNCGKLLAAAPHEHS